MSDNDSILELFHADNDDASAAALRFVSENALQPRIRLRNKADNVALADFKKYGGERFPALFDGEHLVDGREAVLAILSGLLDD